jgi:uncharacterized Ntn-hydrolase superfamily protein
MTYSIVARDPETGELGVAVQTYWFAVGNGVPWLEPGVGAVATQSFVEVSYGPLGLGLMRAGKTAGEALQELLAADEGRELRQVAMVDAQGGVAVHTGDRCCEAAGHTTGDNVSCQANMMEKPTVWPAMMDAYSNATGDIADRMMAALVAAESEGGDIRGRQSAAMVVVPGPGAKPWERSISLTVDDHERPLDELGRLLHVHRAWAALSDASDAAEAGDHAKARHLFERALALQPGDGQITFWAATFYAETGDEARAKELFAASRSIEPRYPEFLRRISDSGFFPKELLATYE